MKYIDCQQCDGHYVLRCGPYGYFGGCSGYPRCRSSIKASKLVLEFLKVHGLNLYGWDKKCWKCQKSTKVYSYFFFYDLGELDMQFGGSHGIGLGDISSLDAIIQQKYPSVKKQFSNTTQSSYIANTCQHCGALQGRNYVVDDPHEIIMDLWHNHSMDKYLMENIKFDCTDKSFIDFLVEEYDNFREIIEP